MAFTKRKLVAFATGVLLTLLALELGLRLVGSLSGSIGAEVGKKGAFTVLCIGDSFTLGVGAPAKRGYPEQLAALLSERYPGKTIQVINRGMGSYNTALIMKRLDDDLRRYKPDLVIFLAGDANLWNSYGFSGFLRSSEFSATDINETAVKGALEQERPIDLRVKEKLPDPANASREDLAGVLNAMLDSTDLYRLFEEGSELDLTHEERKLLRKSLSNEELDRNDLRRLNKAVLSSAYKHCIAAPKKETDWLWNIKIYKLAKRLLFDLQDRRKEFLDNPQEEAIWPKEVHRYLVEVTHREWAGEYEEALALLKNIGRMMPGSPLPHYVQARILHHHLKRIPEAREHYRKAIEMGPQWVEFYSHYALLILQDGINSPDDINFLTNYAKDYPAASDALKRLREHALYDRKVLSWIDADARSFIMKCGEYGVKIVLQSYPNFDAPMTVAVNSVLRKVAASENVPFVDNQREFEELSRLREWKKSEYFAADNSHCNELGYSIMAKNLLRAISGSNYIQQ